MATATGAALLPSFSLLEDEALSRREVALDNAVLLIQMPSMSEPNKNQRPVDGDGREVPE